MKILSTVVGDYNDENNSLHKLLSTYTQIWRLCKAFTSNFTANIKLSKTQLYAAIHKNNFESDMTILIIYNEEMNDIIKIVKSLEKSGLLINGGSKTIKTKTKELDKPIIK